MRSASSWWMLGLGACMAMAACAPREAASAKAAATSSTPRLHSLVELRDANVVKQKFDYSCGAASLATLLRFYFRDPIPEHVLLLDMLQHLPGAEREDRIAHGFTLLDLRDAALRRGYQAEGVELGLPALTQLGGPVLLHMVIQGQRHFVVFRGVEGDRIFLADPNRGNVRMDVWRFKRQWTGIALALGKAGVDVPPGHPLSVRSSETRYPEIQTARQSLYRP